MGALGLPDVDSWLLHLPSQPDLVLQVLFSLLEPANVVSCLEALLSERSVLFVGESASRVALCVEAIRLLLRPLESAHALIVG